MSERQMEMMKSSDEAPNGSKLVIGLRHETKNNWEARTAFSPEQVGKIIKDFGIAVKVQRSATRAFPDEAYERVGAELVDSLDGVKTIFGVKELMIENIQPNTTYVHFSHTFKGQTAGMEFLQALMKSNGSLIDWELIRDPEAFSKNPDTLLRAMKFGPYAGMGGMIDTLHAVGVRMRELGTLTPFMHISRAYHYPSLEEAKNAVQRTGEEIRANGIPSSLNPLVVTFTSTGDVSKNALSILKLLPSVEIKAEDLDAFMKMSYHDPHVIYYVVATQEHMVRHKDGRAFAKAEYYADPAQFEPVFHKDVLPHTSIFMQCMYWEPKFPRLVTIEQGKNGACKRMLAIGELGCDIEGPVEFLFNSTRINDAYFMYDTQDGKKHNDWTDQRKTSFPIYAVDHIPSELACDATTFFGGCALPYVPQIATYGATRSGDVLAPNVYNALEVHCGALTSKHAHLQQHIDKHVNAPGS